MGEGQRPLESILVADCGTTWTKIVLLDVVEGRYRFVGSASAPSTGSEPWDDVSLGVVHAVRALEETTGRRMVDVEGDLIVPEALDGRGVDLFVAVSSAAEPLKVLLGGVARDVSLASARRAVRTTYCTIADEIALEQREDDDAPRDDDAQIRAIWAASPDVICLVGGTDGGAEEPVLEIVRDVVRVALYLMGEDVPTIVYAGNAALREQVSELLGDLAPIEMVDNVRPRLHIEHVGPAAEELELQFYQKRMKYLPGADVLRDWSGRPVLPAARTADYVVRYCDRAWHADKPALAVDIGSASVMVQFCGRGRPETVVRNDVGVGCALMGLLDQVPVQDMLRWLPYELSEGEARDRLLNKALRPHSIPQTREDILLEHAAARETVRVALRDMRAGGEAERGWFPACDPIILSGGVLAHVPYHGYAALLLLDAVQPLGISELYLDEYDVLATMGALVDVAPLAMVEVLRNGGLTFLGTVVVPVGRLRRGEVALQVRPVDQASSVSSDVTYGSLEAIPYQFFEPGTRLELVPARGVDIGNGPGKRVEIPYRGGTVGLIVDARGRPLQFARDAAEQRQRMDYWLWEMMSA